MGVGKSTLTAALADRLGADAYYESIAENPYLERFYEDMGRWSFHSQFTFLSQAFRQHCDILSTANVSVQDRTIYEHFHVFVTSHFEQGILEEEQFRSLEDHFRSLTRVVPGPDLMIYLRASVPTLVERIRGRDRSIEANVQVEYLQGLEDRYERWMASYDSSDVLVIDTDNIDIHDAEQREMLLSLIEERVAGRSAKAPFAAMRRRRAERAEQRASSVPATALPATALPA
ncbi:MAG: Deoxyguanosine kinase / deoxyadenosine kinase subunit [Thermoleophilia bacterium]|nr:Deoxyguanosine kinase / deoxyadenosine kinase subunit [Thermoleophilia bacterium]